MLTLASQAEPIQRYGNLHWKIRWTLQELWVELSGCAAACYLAAGWRRTAEGMLAEVAEQMMAGGQPGIAAAIAQRQARHLLAAGWARLGAHLLHDIVCCQEELYQVMA